MTFAIHQFYCTLFHTHSADQALHKPQSMPLHSLLKISWGAGGYCRVSKLHPNTDPHSAYGLPASCPSEGTRHPTCTQDLSFSRGHFQLQVNLPFNLQSLLSLAFTCFQSGLGNGYSYPVKTDLEHLAKDDLSYENMMT